MEEYLTLLRERSVAPAHFALAWCLAQPGVTSPIIGPRTMEQMEDYLKALDVTVTEDDSKQMDAIFEPGTHVSNYYSADFGPNARWGLITLRRKYAGIRVRRTLGRRPLSRVFSTHGK